MAETLLSFGVEKLWDFLVRESERLNGVDEELTALKRDINLLRSFLEDADAKKHANVMVKHCVEEIKEIVLDAEDVIETFLLKEELGRTSGIRKRMRRRVFSIVVRRKLALDMGGISQRISKVIQDMQSFGVQEKKVDSKPLQERQREMRCTFPSNNESNFVGLETNVKKLVDYLVEEDCIQVVSICGMGGIGKTTLAQQVFNHERVKSHFDGVAWVCISQQFTRKYLWQTILEKLSSKHDEHRESNMNHMSEDRLQDKLFRLLKTTKSLIVLDDMWRKEEWDRIKHVFPPTKGWKILLTSRNERVTLHVDPTCFILRPECLTLEESWTLFKMIASTRNDTTEFKVDDGMEEICKQIFKYCGGLPLAIKVLGGLLVAEHTLDEWKRIYENIQSHLADKNSFGEENHNSIQHVLSLSYEELPISLKHCFLYLAHFPEDYPIDMAKLSYYWAAEGILKHENYERVSIRDVADMYMEELVKRNMVMSERDYRTSRFETCRLHDMMREICLLKAKEEKFLEIIRCSSSTSSESLNRSRRLGVQQDPNVMKAEMKYSKLRSLMYIMKKDWMDSSLCFTQLQLMRVLDISYAMFEGGKLPSSIGDFIHLRYLSLFEAKATNLPSSMRNLKKLLYLNLGLGGRPPIYVPNILKEMQELRYLSLPSPWRVHGKTKLELGNLVNLETLLHFSTKHSSVEDLRGMTRLMTLLIIHNGEGCTEEALSSSLSELSHLENLHIDPLLLDAPKKDEEFVLDCVHLKHIFLNIYMPRLPDEQHLSSHLTTISLVNCRLEKDPMPILEKLLHLKHVTLWYKSFCGKRMVCSRGRFPQLQKLLLFGLKEWEEWIVEEGSMPLLHTLALTRCEKLKYLPDGMRFITSLKELNIEYMGDEWKKERFLEGGEDYYKVQHIPTIKFGVNPFWRIPFITYE